MLKKFFIQTCFFIFLSCYVVDAFSLDEFGQLTKDDQKFYKNDSFNGKNQIERIDDVVKEINILHKEINFLKLEIENLKKENLKLRQEFSTTTFSNLEKK